MNMSQFSYSLWSCNLKCVDYVLFVIVIALNIYHFQISIWKGSVISVIWPILFRLVASFRIIERAQHDDNWDVLVIDGLPKIIKFLYGCLTKDSKNIAIYKGSYLIGIDIIFGDVLDFNPTMFILIIKMIYMQRCRCIDSFYCSKD